MKDRIEIAFNIILAANREVIIIEEPTDFATKFAETKRAALIKLRDHKLTDLVRSKDAIIHKYKNPQTCPPETQDPHRDLGPNFKALAVEARIVIQELMKKNADIYSYKDEIVGDFKYDKDAVQGSVTSVSHFSNLVVDRRFQTMCEHIRKEYFSSHLATINEHKDEVAGIVDQTNKRSSLPPPFKSLVEWSIDGAKRALKDAIAAVEVCKKPTSAIGDAKALADAVSRNFNDVNWVIKPLSWSYLNRMRVVSLHI